MEKWNKIMEKLSKNNGKIEQNLRIIDVKIQ